MRKYVETFESFSKLSYEFDIPTEEFLEKVLSAMNINYISLTIISEGGHGFATDLGNGAIFKITSDPVEAYYASKLIGIESPNLVSVYDFKEIKSKYGKLYGIHQEKLNTNVLPVIKLMAGYLQKRNPLTEKILDNTVSYSEVISFLKPKMVSLDSDSIMFMFNKIYDIYKECVKYGLPVEELHGRNIGTRFSDPKKLVYFDISSPVETIVPDLEVVTI